MYILYFKYDGHWVAKTFNEQVIKKINKAKTDANFAPYPNESCWIVPGTVDPREG